MAETKQEKLVAILKELRKIGDIQGSSVVSRDGLIIAADLSQDIDEETFAAMSAAMQGAAETAVSELKRGALNEIIIDAEKGKLVSIGAGELAILVCISRREVNLGLLRLELNKVAKKITSVIG
jgi:predicted regulator of Ras-like GTPase activity (Roadblock/LC7/MglB family)